MQGILNLEARASWAPRHWALSRQCEMRDSVSSYLYADRDNASYDSIVRVDRPKDEIEHCRDTQKAKKHIMTVS